MSEPNPSTDQFKKLLSPPVDTVEAWVANMESLAMPVRARALCYLLAWRAHHAGVPVESGPKMWEMLCLDPLQGEDRLAMHNSVASLIGADLIRLRDAANGPQLIYLVGVGNV